MESHWRRRDCPKDIYFDVGYVGSKGTRLTATYDGNRPNQIVTRDRESRPSLSRRPFKGFDTISVTKSIGNSTYHSMQLKAERRSARGTECLGAYTWSHSISNADISSVGGGAYLAAIQDYMDLDGSRSDSVFDIRHGLSIAAIYDVPLFRDRRGNACPDAAWRLATRHHHHRPNRLRRGSGWGGRHHRYGHRLTSRYRAGSGSDA